MSPDEKRPVVVCVDDEPRTLASLRRQLRKEPYELLLTEDPLQALEWIAGRRPALLISDQRMPRMSGIDLLELVREHWPATACMILSGCPDTARLLEHAELRIERFIPKPWDGEELKASIRRVLERRDAAEEVEFRIACAGKTARQVIAEILPLPARARGLGKRPVVVLADLRRLNDSVSRLLKNLARAAAWFGLPLDLRDASGFLEAFVAATTTGPPASHGNPPDLSRPFSGA